MSYKIGDSVIIAHLPQKSEDIPWEVGMNDHCGCEGVVTSIDWAYTAKIFAVKSIGMSGQEKTWWYQENWLMREDNSYWGKFTSHESYRSAGLKELARQQNALNEKRDEILRKMFSK